MFSLEQTILKWRKQMLAAGIKSPVPLEELEIHLRDEIERQMKFGLREQPAFEIAVQKIGAAGAIKDEFKKIDAENWNRPLGWTAWILFAFSFLLPSHTQVGLGWRCAYLSAGDFVSAEFWHGKLGGDFHLALLTLSNALMIVSSLFLIRFSQSVRLIKWFCLSSFLALVLVWSFILRWVVNDNVHELKCGCWVWAVSFLLLFLATAKSFSHKKFTAKYV